MAKDAKHANFPLCADIASAIAINDTNDLIKLWTKFRRVDRNKLRSAWRRGASIATVPLNKTQRAMLEKLRKIYLQRGLCALRSLLSPP